MFWSTNRRSVAALVCWITHGKTQVQFYPFKLFLSLWTLAVTASACLPQPTTAPLLSLQTAVQWTGHTPTDTAERVQGQQASVHGERRAAVEAAQRRPAGEPPPPLTHLTLQLTTELCLFPHNCTFIAQIAPTTLNNLFLSSNLRLSSSTFYAWQRWKLFQIQRQTSVTAAQSLQCCWILVTATFGTNSIKEAHFDSKKTLLWLRCT